MKPTPVPLRRFLAVCAVALCGATLHSQAADKPNVLFIAIDDLNH